MDDRVTAVWNRAVDLELPDLAPFPGDAALVTVLTFHSLVSNGGLLNAAELHRYDTMYPSDAVVEAYRYLGLDDAAGVIDNAVLEQRDLPDDIEDDDLDAARERIDDTYTLTDDDIEQALTVRLATDPDAFAPVG